MTPQTIIISTIISILPLGFLIPETGVKCGDVAGMYIWNGNNEGKIYVCEIGDTEFTKYHEIGHKIWRESLTTEQRIEYTLLYNSAKSFYREYSKTSVLEDFADNFATLMIKKNQNKDIQKRKMLIRKFIK